MSANLIIKSELLRPLAPLALIPQGAAAYYRDLRLNADPIIAAAAWCGLLDNRLIAPSMFEALLPFCRFAAVRTRAFSFFQSVYEHDYASRAAETAASSVEDAQQQAMRAELGGDSVATANAQGDLYLATGDLARLELASQAAETGGGWRAALEWALRAVVVAPLSPLPYQRLYIVLESSGQPDLMDEVAAILAGRGIQLPVAQMFAATAALTRGDPAGCLAKLKSLDDSKLAAANTVSSFSGHLRALRAQAEEKLGNYKAAYKTYVELNEGERARNIDPEDFYRGIVARGALTIPTLPKDTRDDVVQMTGFARSGTTLLENALGAHPLIETFEEISALQVAINQIELAIFEKRSRDIGADKYLLARARYYGEIDFLRAKTSASVLIDKMPVRSSDAEFLSKLFPDWRYIFTIRHPYDVVLSCFKQRFVANPTMENYHSIDQTARAYDYSMTEWFKYHTMDDPKVHYLRYDELVTDFERVMREALGFLGIAWDDAVLNFSKNAEKRAVKTPSYHKVRQGLSIGVQTQWQNYKFAFQSEATKPLKKWAEFFGYHTE